MYPIYNEKTGANILYKNNAIKIVIYERAVRPSIVFECNLLDFGFDNASICRNTFEYREQWHLNKTVEKYINAEQVNTALGINVYEDWMFTYYQGILLTNRMRGISGRD